MIAARITLCMYFIYKVRASINKVLIVIGIVI